MDEGTARQAAVNGSMETTPETGSEVPVYSSDPVRPGNAIVVNECDNSESGIADTGVPRRSRTRVILSNRPDCWPGVYPALEDPGGIAVRTVIHNNDFKQRGINCLCA